VHDDLAGRPLAGIELVDAVQYAQQGRLAAARRPDEGGDALLVERKAYALQRLEPVVEEVKVADLDLWHRLRFGCRSAVGGLAAPRRRQSGRQRAAREGSLSDRGWIHRFMLLQLASARAAMLRRRTTTVMRSAPPRASRCQSS